MWRKSNAVLLALLSAVSGAASEPNLLRFEAAEPHMGTLVRITLFARDGDQARRGFEAAFGRIRELDEKLSDYRPDSELTRLCARAGEGPVAVSDALFRVLDWGQRLAEQTEGKFDLTLGPVIRLWREARRQQRLPDREALDQASRRIGFRKTLLDSDWKTVTLREPGMELDLGGIAKGFAADEALNALVENNITRALVAVAGDIALGDPPPGRSGWRIGIELSGRPEGTFTGILELRNTAISTSGDSGQYLEADGLRYSHIVDPADSQALTDSIAVTVIARRGIDADSLATAVSVMGAESGLKFIEDQTRAAALVRWREAGQLRERATTRFPRFSKHR